MAGAQIALTLGQTVPTFAWFKLVNDTVPEPYLDEVFHARQAQAYCASRFDIWDPKITTPPGLYLLSYLASFLGGCTLPVLRALNVYALVSLSAVVARIYAVLGAEDGVWIAHSALNLMLFPPLFFFSALYYTDVVSTLSVLQFYWFFLYAEHGRKPLWFKAPILLVLGATSLLFRQTNIFWVAVFPAGIVLVNQIDRGQSVVKQSMHHRADGFGDSIMSVARTSFKMGAVCDLPVRDAWIEDYAMTTISIAACTAGITTRPTRLAPLLQALSPYLTLLALFVTFILWNGGVVLGDKSNHIATLHLPQMLYLWPLLTFFSWPLLYPYLLTVPMHLLAQLPAIAPLEGALIFKRRQLLPRPWLSALAALLAVTAVHFNTIVHPFTLADNRHYTFYVFRLLTRPAWVKYAVAPLYVLCAWACTQALGARPPRTTSSTTTTKKQDPAEMTTASEPRPLDLPNGSLPARTSFLLVWLATCTLQLTTAPLVEPRYFILPWLLWRLHLPLQPSTTSRLDPRMLLETAWLLAVNAGTCYVFLARPFAWSQEPGARQRFMW